MGMTIDLTKLRFRANNVRRMSSGRSGGTPMPQAWSRSGSVLPELITGLAIIAALLIVVANLTSAFERASVVSLARHRAWLAAQGQIEKMRAGLAPLADSDITDEDGNRMVVVVEDASGAWAPLKLVTVTAETFARPNRKVGVTLRGYVEPTIHSVETGP